MALYVSEIVYESYFRLHFKDSSSTSGVPIIGFMTLGCVEKFVSQIFSGSFSAQTNMFFLCVRGLIRKRI